MKEVHPVALFIALSLIVVVIYNAVVFSQGECFAGTVTTTYNKVGSDLVVYGSDIDSERDIRIGDTIRFCVYESSITGKLKDIKVVEVTRQPVEHIGR